MLNVVQMQLKNNLMVLTHRNWNPAKCLFTPRACNLLFEGANLSYSCLIILFMFSRYRKTVKKMNYIERWAKQPSNPFTAVFYPSISIMAFEVQIYGCRSTAVPVKWMVHSPRCKNPYLAGSTQGPPCIPVRCKGWKKKRKESMDSTKRCLQLLSFFFFFSISGTHHVLQAFVPKSRHRADRQLGRWNIKQDQTRLHIPLVNRTPDNEPPQVIIAIVGCPGVGKMTLLENLTPNKC